MDALQTHLERSNPREIQVTFVRRSNKYFIEQIGFENVNITFNPPNYYSILVKDACNEYDRYTVRYTLDSDLAQYRLRRMRDEDRVYIPCVTGDVEKQVPMCFFPVSWAGRWVLREVITYTRHTEGWS